MPSISGWFALFGSVLFAAGQTPVAVAMQFSPIITDGNTVIIHATGPIIEGDIARLSASFAGLAQNAQIWAIDLDSPGGSVVAAEELLQAVRSLKLSTIVYSGEQCASACFLIFAAGRQKIAMPDALVGVHSASEDGRETSDSAAFTVAMARESEALGVPYSIVGKLVSARPNQMAWLTPADLAALGVHVLQPDAPDKQSSQSRPATPMPQMTFAPSAAVPKSAETRAFYDGLVDRRAMESWKAALPVDARAGADFWAATRSSNKASCFGPTAPELGPWLDGCVAAQKMMNPMDARRKSEPDYRRGWNSF